MNLIDDPWIPVATRSGRRVRIAPWQVTEGMESDPIIMVAAPRPDFSGALLEFLIGLFQTEAAPVERHDWALWKRQPPSPAELKERLGPASPYFELFGDGPRFMQSLHEFKGKEKPIADLVVDDPPSEMVKKNKDLFIKRGRITGLCPACTAAALYVANAYSPAAGRGHRTSLRGGGPVTTVVTADPAVEPDQATLWHTLWLNVMPRRTFESVIPGNRELTGPQAIYPWLAPTRTSENGEVTTPEDMSPYHVFWGMPRRIQLRAPSTGDGRCSICQRQADLFETFRIRHGGMNYEGAWIHPLTPYSFDEQGAPAPLHMPRGGLGYRRWPALATGQQERKVLREPARALLASLRAARGATRKLRIFAFGYDVDNAKIRGWYEHRAPAYVMASDTADHFRELASGMVRAADEVAGNLRSALREAWKIEKSPEFAVASFWADTEARFFSRLDRLLENLGDEVACRADLQGWHDDLCETSERLFETWAEAGDIGATDPGRIARAHRALRRFNRKKSIRDALFLPDPKSRGTKGGTT